MASLQREIQDCREIYRRAVAAKEAAERDAESAFYQKYGYVIAAISRDFLDGLRYAAQQCLRSVRIYQTKMVMTEDEARAWEIAMRDLKRAGCQITEALGKVSYPCRCYWGLYRDNYRNHLDQSAEVYTVSFE